MLSLDTDCICSVCIIFIFCSTNTSRTLQDTFLLQ